MHEQNRFHLHVYVLTLHVYCLKDLGYTILCYLNINSESQTTCIKSIVFNLQEEKMLKDLRDGIIL